MFRFFPANLMSSTCTSKNNPFLNDAQRDIPNLEPSPNRVVIGFFQIAFSITVLSKDDPYRFRSRRTTGSSTLDHDFGHLCRGRRIQMSGHSDFGISDYFGASSIFTWV